MKDTDFVIGPDQKKSLVTVHARKPDGGLDPIEFGVPQEPEFFMGGGGLYGTGRDYLAFLQMLMHGGEFNSKMIRDRDGVLLYVCVCVCVCVCIWNGDDSRI